MKRKSVHLPVPDLDTKFSKNPHPPPLLQTSTSSLRDRHQSIHIANPTTHQSPHDSSYPSERDLSLSQKPRLISTSHNPRGNAHISTRNQFLTVEALNVSRMTIKAPFPRTQNLVTDGKLPRGPRVQSSSMSGFEQRTADQGGRKVRLTEIHLGRFWFKSLS